MPLSVCLSAIGRGIVLDTKEPERPLMADSVEKVGLGSHDRKVRIGD